MWKLFRNLCRLRHLPINVCSSTNGILYNNFNINFWGRHFNNFNACLQGKIANTENQMDYKLDSIKFINDVTEKREDSVLEPREREDMSDLDTNLQQTLTLASFVDKSPSLQQLIKLGVDLSVIEGKKGAAKLIVSLDFDRDIKPYLIFLHDAGLKAEDLGKFITKAPFIFKESLEDLKIRINYLESKKFSKDMIVWVLKGNPRWLLHPVKTIDNRLGYFQKTYHLKGDEVRELVMKSAKLITYPLEKVQLVTFTLKEEFAFEDREVKRLLMTKPKIFRASQALLIKRFEFVHNIMKIPNELILQFPQVLLSRYHVLRERHLFLESLGRAQYNPNMPGYVNLDNICNGNDSEFCENIAKTTMQTYNMFLKTIG